MDDPKPKRRGCLDPPREKWSNIELLTRIFALVPGLTMVEARQIVMEMTRTARNEALGKLKAAMLAQTDMDAVLAQVEAVRGSV